MVMASFYSSKVTKLDETPRTSNHSIESLQIYFVYDTNVYFLRPILVNKLVYIMYHELPFSIRICEKSKLITFPWLTTKISLLLCLWFFSLKPIMVCSLELSYEAYFWLCLTDNTSPIFPLMVPLDGFIWWENPRVIDAMKLQPLKMEDMNVHFFFYHIHFHVVSSLTSSFYCFYYFLSGVSPWLREHILNRDLYVESTCILFSPFWFTSFVYLLSLPWPDLQLHA